jgi:hypothetical protein
MTSKLTGRVLFANGLVAPGIQVRVFDRDAPGKTDDDLTVTPGLSDSSGHFTVTFDIGKYQDYNSFNKISLLGFDIDWSAISRNIHLPDLTDEYRPYLQFKYHYHEQDCTYTAPLGLFATEFHLPQSEPFRLVPSIHGFKFPNIFPGYPLPFSVPVLPGITDVTPAYGLCGGMSSASYDFLLAGRKVPITTKAPRRGSLLHRYLYRRAIDTFGSFGESLLKVAAWMRLPEDGLTGAWKRTLDEFSRIRARIDTNNAVILCMIYVGADSLSDIFKEIWNNHQVLAYAWRQTSAEAIELNLYDPNYPVRDDVILRCERVVVSQVNPSLEGKSPVYGLRCTQWIGSQMIKPVRGFFPMPYVPVEPPRGLS